MRWVVIMEMFRSLTAGNRNLKRDLIGILLAFIAGISGQLFLLNPLRVLAPELPMLSPRDWPGSQYNLELLSTDGRPWSEYRAFQRNIVLIKDGVLVKEAEQTIVWYANLTQAAAAWDQHRREPYHDFPVVDSNTRKKGPESLLFCSPGEPYISPLCSYRAYWKHWYTNVDFYGRTDEDLPLSEVQKLTDRIDQLLMSAPDRPCQWFSCIGIGNEIEP